MSNLNSFTLLSHLFDKLNIPVTKTTILSELQKHPEPSSLLALSDLLDQWNVPNGAYNVDLSELLSTELQLPFIACFGKAEFVLVTGKNESQLTVLSNQWDNQVMSNDEFEKHYNGTILAIEKDEFSGEADYSTKRRKEIVEKARLPFVLSGIAIIFIIYLSISHNYLANFNLYVSLLTLFKVLGLVTSIFLLLQSIDINNPLIKRVCGSESDKNCNAILSSGAAKFIKEISWSEIGFFYFAGTLVVLLFNIGNNNIMRYLAILNILSLPYTVYSIYYQSRVAKQWCVFCCAVQALLWAEFFVLLPYFSTDNLFLDLNSLGVLLIGFLIPIIMWVFLKPHLISSIELQTLKPELYRYKYNKQLFQNMLLQEDKYALPSDQNTIVIGNNEATNLITLVSNPFCGHCSKAHLSLDELLSSRDDIKLQLVFVIRRHKRESDHKVIRHFMALKSNKDEELLKKAINDWYKQENKKYELWSQKYPVIDTDMDSEMILKQQEWSTMVNITSTPSIFINGQRLPQVYKSEDIKYVL